MNKSVLLMYLNRLNVLYECKWKMFWALSEILQKLTNSPGPFVSLLNYFWY